MVTDLSPALLPQPLDPQHRDLPVDLGLDLGQPGQRVQLGHQLLQRLGRRFGRLSAAEVGRRVVGGDAP